MADIDNDGVLELLVAHGESNAQGLTFYQVTNATGNNWIRILPLTRYGAPARGSKVSVSLNGPGNKKLTRVIDGGSGYLCAMEPVAHFGLGTDTVRSVQVTWPNGQYKQITLSANDMNKQHEIPITGAMRSQQPSYGSSRRRSNSNSYPNYRSINARGSSSRGK